jgi:hypothetical protein
MMTNETKDLETNPKKINRRNFLIAGVGATLTAATLAGTSDLAAAQSTGSEVRYQAFPGAAIPLPETYMSDHYSDGIHPPKKEMATGNMTELYKLSGMKNPYPDGDLGVIKEGAYADMLLVEGNPLEDIKVIGETDNLLIIKDGKIYKNKLQ